MAPSQATLDAVTTRLRQAGCVWAEEEAALLLAAAEEGADLETVVSERCSGVPLEYVVGWTEFCGERLTVRRGVFVPRPRTEGLVAVARRLLPSEGVLLDLCCGVAPIAAALRSSHPAVHILASDIDPAAVACARHNAAGRRIEVVEGDLFEALPRDLRGAIDLIVVNAPYVPSGELDDLPREARDYEPRATLDGGEDGLVVHRRVAAEGPAWLAPGGRIATEVGAHQSRACVEVFAAAGLPAEAVYEADTEATVVVAGPMAG